LEDCGREVLDREITDAIRNAGKKSGNLTIVSWVGSLPKPKWPTRDARMVSRLVNEAPSALDRFRSKSSTMPSEEGITARRVVDELFPGDPLLCLGHSLGGMKTRLKSSWLGFAANQQFIVPSPMRAIKGINQEGKSSDRCLDNTGSRRFLVVEFDQNSIGEQASLHSYLSGLKPLVLLVHSGGKSLHGWYCVEGEEDVATRSFMERAVQLGADFSTWPRCQAVRVPGGLRSNGSLQRIEFFDPEYKGGLQ